MDADRLMELMTLNGFERVLKLFYGVYRAKVVDNRDEEKRGRIQISCPSIGEDGITSTGAWLDPVFDSAGPSCGVFFPPVVGSNVYVFYFKGSPGMPVGYLGGWFTTDDGTCPLPSKLSYGADGVPNRRGIVTRAGHSLVFDDTPGKEQVTLMWHKPGAGDPALTDPSKSAANNDSDQRSVIQLGNDGSVVLWASDGSRIVLDTAQKQLSMVDSFGNWFYMTEEGITLTDGNGESVALDRKKGDVTIVAQNNFNVACKAVNFQCGGVGLGNQAPMSAVLGELLYTWLSAHAHGPPGSPPATPPPPSMLSRNVKVL